MNFRPLIRCLLILALTRQYAHAQTMNQPNAARANTAWLTKAIAQHLTIPAGTLYVDGTATTKTVVGCGRLKSDGCFGIGGYGEGHPNLGSLTRIVQLGKGPILRLSGNGFVCDDPIEWVGDGDSAAIEVEGRSDPPSGRHRFRDQIFTNCGAWVKCLATPNEAKGDTSVVDCCEGYGCKRVFWSQNQQAIPWHFRDCTVNYLGDDKGCVVADVERGGWLTFSNLTLNHPQVTLLKVRDFSPNQCTFRFDRVLRDRPQQQFFKDNYLTIFEFAGKPEDAVYIPHWLHCLDVTGFVPIHETPFDRSHLYRNVPAEYLATPPASVKITFTGTPK